ncbi:MAG: insulinase family protein [Bacteroidetes bacterium]|nr:insulinase family protein [Bacteroidota bacterium]
MKTRLLFISLFISLSLCSNAQQAVKITNKAPIQQTLVQPIQLSGKIEPYLKDTIANDPLNVKIYTLRNGLKVFISVNKDAPRIQTYIAVKAGSKFDPPQTTGLAHYLEHMMFKGSHDFGTKDWSKEKPVLDSISAYFEYHKIEKDEAKKKVLYAKIDSFSYEASKWAIPNEYDKMATSIGAQGTNAFTSTDMTVYTNDVPSNGLEKFLMLEGNKFKTCVLRIFHTELETVYEEFNRNQDNDRVWSDHNVNNALLPNHPYGTQTTIGEGEHLKNPSMINIYNYFNTYYRPNNVAIILAGDLDPEATMNMIEKYFGDWQPAIIPQFVVKPAPELTAPVYREYKGPQPEHVYIGYLFGGANSKDALMVKIVDMVLANGQAGLIDLDLVQQQKTLSAGCYPDENTDYTFHKFYGEPKQGQSLEEVKDLLLAEIEKVKKGEFGDWILPAIIQNLKLERMKVAESNQGRAGALMGAFVHNVDWKDWVNEIDELSKITKADVVKFANDRYRNNYVVSYKRQGEATVHKVEKPTITAVVMNKEDVSGFKRRFDDMPQPSLTPKFIDFNKDITHLKMGNGEVTFDYIKNDVNKTFKMSYIFDMGTDHIKDLGLAIDYLEYLGTDKYTSEDLKKEFYKLGLTFGVNSGRDRVYVSLSGLEDNLEKGVELFEHILFNVKADKGVYEEMVMDEMQQRMNAKKNKGAILQGGMVNYAKYGAFNPYNNVMSEAELKNEEVNKLVALIKSLSGYKHKIFYYGNRNANNALSVVSKYHKTQNPLKAYPDKKSYPELAIDQTKVYVCYYPMKQAEIMMIGKDGIFNKDLYPYIYLYNDYYGSGLSSIMFQEIREKMALAYSVYSGYGVPQYPNESHYLTSYVGTQADKMKTALFEMNKLLNDMPEVPQQFEGARASVVKTLESDWVTRSDMYWAYDRALKRGMNYDVRKTIYDKAKTLNLPDIRQFFNEHVKGKKYTYLVIGKKEDLDMNVLKGIGPVQELSLEQLFGY